MTYPHQSGSMPAHPAALEVRLLGSFYVAVGDRRTPESVWRQRRVSALIKLLALAPGFRLHREQIMETLWPGLSVRAAANNLRVTLHYARRALGSAGAPPGRLLTRDGEHVVLARPDRIWVDVAAFGRAAEQAWRLGDPGSFYQAIDLYGGDLLPDDVYDEWLAAGRARLRESYLALLAGVAALEEERGVPDQAIGALGHLLAEEPSDEKAARRLMRLLAGSGRRKEALAIYEQLRVALKRELDAEPEPPTENLIVSIREGSLAPQGVGGAGPVRPSPAAGGDGPSNLRAEMSNLIDREREIAEVGELLATARLVTLTGIGGIGKTRLARAVGARLLPAYRDGVFIVDLARVRHPDGLALAIAQMLGVRDATGQTIAANVSGFLRDRELLLILDDFERLVAAAPLVADLLADCPALSVLVTSRERLKLRGEQVYPVSSLAVPAPGIPATAAELAGCASVELFRDRARAVRPDFRLTDENSMAVAEICRRLDGLPLAIELAAAQITVLTPETMLPRLDRRLSFLSADFRDSPKRQQTMRDTIGWSYDLLDPDEQRLFRSLVVFTGGWTFDAAEATCVPDLDAAGLLASLVDKSLVLRTGQYRSDAHFDMLETVREFGSEQLEAHGEVEFAWRRHAEYVVRLVRSAAPHLAADDAEVWLDHLEADQGNLRASLDWLLETGSFEVGLELVSNLKYFWFHRGSLAEGSDYTQAFLDLAEASPPSVARAIAIESAGMLRLWQRDYDGARRLLDTARVMYAGLGNLERLAPVLSALGTALSMLKDEQSAICLWEESLTLARAHGDPGQQAAALNWLAHARADAGDYAASRAMLSESLALFQAAGHTPNVALTLRSMGDLALQQRDFQHAAVRYADSLKIFRRLGSNWGIITGIERVSVLAGSQGRLETARSLAATGEVLRVDAGLGICPDERDELDRLLAATGASHTFADAVVEAQQSGIAPMTLDEAVDLALTACDVDVGIIPDATDCHVNSPS